MVTLLYSDIYRMFSNRKIILIILLLFTVSIVAYVLLVTIPRRVAEQSYDGARRLGKDLQEAFRFTPQIKVNNTIVIQQQTGILELATLSQKFNHQYTWRNTRLGSTKEIRVTGTFDAKAGFDMNEEFFITIEGEKATVIFPAPKLLSIESFSDMQFKDENGIWNWVNQEDRTRAINAFTRDAKQYAATADFIPDAGKIMEEKLVEILRPHVKEIEIRIGDRVTTKKVPEKIDLK